MSTPEEQKPPDPPDPGIFVDRSLGAKQVPDALRAAGFVVAAMFEIYGVAFAEGLADPPWIKEACERGEIIFACDKFRQPEVKAAIRKYGARCFVLAEGELLGPDQVQYYLNNIEAIMRVARERPGPYVYKVYEREIKPWWS